MSLTRFRGYRRRSPGSGEAPRHDVVVSSAGQMRDERRTPRPALLGDLRFAVV
jgi:hypothetical protein